MPDKSTARRSQALSAMPFAALLRDAQPGPDPSLRELFSATGIAFIHVPKNAGSSVSHFLYARSIKHRTWECIRNLDPDAYHKRWFKFAIIREPVDRFLSAFTYLKRGGRNELDHEFARRFVLGYQLAHFVEKLELDDVFRKQVMSWFHFQPQIGYVTAPEGSIMVDRLVPFENINLELPGLVGKHGNVLPHINRSASTRVTLNESAELASAICRLYANDVDLYRASKS